MKYNSVTYRFDKKNQRYRFFYESEYFESGNTGHYIQSGNFFDVYKVNNHFVAIKYSVAPVYVCDSFEELCKYIEKETGCIPQKV